MRHVGGASEGLSLVHCELISCLDDTMLKNRTSVRFSLLVA